MSLSRRRAADGANTDESTLEGGRTVVAGHVAVHAPAFPNACTTSRRLVCLRSHACPLLTPRRENGQRQRQSILVDPIAVSCPTWTTAGVVGCSPTRDQRLDSGHTSRPGAVHGL